MLARRSKGLAMRSWRPGGLGIQQRVLFVLDFTGTCHLDVLGRDEFVEIALVVNGGNGLAKTSGLRSSLSGLVLEGVHNQAIAKKKLFVESSYNVLGFVFNYIGSVNLPNFCICRVVAESVSDTKSWRALIASGRCDDSSCDFSVCSVWTWL